ncbi:hypothetical protein [Larkinella soli]|uniref:hypothetical protein n=1 Tax=Larkinella soli TaxID=1770527 RepID=UPI000FFC47AE|nr:hypothetical protein [Larkinella soli]
MKKVLIFLFALLTFAACKKENDPQPEPKDPISSVAGSYKMSSFHFVQGADELELPKLPLVEAGKTVASGTAVIKKTSTGATMDVTLKLDGEGTIALIEDMDIEVRESGKVFGLYAGGDRIGDADGSNIIFNISGTDPDTGDKLSLAFTAKK